MPEPQKRFSPQTVRTLVIGWMAFVVVAGIAVFILLFLTLQNQQERLAAAAEGGLVDVPLRDGEGVEPGADLRVGRPEPLRVLLGQDDRHAEQLGEPHQAQRRLDDEAGAMDHLHQLPL